MGNISKRGEKTSFSLLIQGPEHTKNGGSNFSSFYDRKYKGKRKTKVRVALVRKTVVALYYMLKNKQLNKEVNHKSSERKLKEIERIKKKFINAA